MQILFDRSNELCGTAMKSTVMDVDNAESETMPLDLSVRKSSPVPTERNDPEPEEASPPDEDRKPTPLDLSPGSLVPPPPPPSTISCEPFAQRASVLVRSPKAAAPATAGKDTHRVPVMSPLIADHVSPLGHFAAMPDAYQHIFATEYNPYFAAAAAAAVAAATSAPQPPLPLPPITAQFHHHHHHHQQQLQLQQQQLQLQQQQQLQLQIQQQLHQQQQQQLSTYGGHAFELNPMTMKPNMTSPMYVATASPSSSESNPFPFGGYDCFPKTAAYGFGYPTYLDGIFGTGGPGEYGSCGGGGSVGMDSSGSGCRSDDCMSPESTTVDHLNMCSADNPDVDPEEVAAIYRQSDFVSFRNRYLESLGPPKNFEKMRRSIPNKMNGGQHMFDQTYVMKRQKNNEAAKRSRDAKRQKYIENQISVMYLTKKVSELKEIKRRLLMSM
ncbi:bromodomain-containing protein 4A-like isoform X2 [Sipha flava]|uniref:Bromodomain-containing protein 4A-like isoform X2 n=1 Tax=Sipha flava TaxID=143950 RepID=A0A2S2QGK3_9HEMI|nr:bromodomain-containing protein 4A-like isoform X2 [Sipha flava]